MFNINTNKWDDEILKIENSKVNLPLVKNSADDFGTSSKKIIGEEIPINAVLGDQQAAAVGQACFNKGSVKSTYGTGAFAIMNTGNNKILSKNKLLTTICYRLKNKNLESELESLTYDEDALEGYARQELGLIKEGEIIIEIEND